MRNLIIGLVATSALAGCEPSTTIGGNTIDIPVGGDTADQGTDDNSSDDPTRESNGTGGDDNDDDSTSTSIWCLDVDDDGYGDASEALVATDAANGYVSDCRDCNDDSASVHPGASDTTADGVDQDCNGTDATTSTTYTWYDDDDGDGYGDASDKTTTSSSTAPSGYVSNSADCDDTNANVNPGKSEVAGNGLNDDCNSATSDTASSTWYKDADGDGYGNASSTTSNTTQPSGYVANDDDCNDSSAAVSPADAEVTGDGVDNDCNTATSDTATSTTCASGTSLITGKFTASSASATIVSISGMAEGTGSLAGEFGWTTLADGTPSGMDITVSSNAVSFSYATCLDDAATVNMSVYYTLSGADRYDCESSAFTGTWSVYRDGVADTATVASNGGVGCDMEFYQ